MYIKTTWNFFFLCYVNIYFVFICKKVKINKKVAQITTTIITTLTDADPGIPQQTRQSVL